MMTDETPELDLTETPTEKPDDRKQLIAQRDAEKKARRQLEAKARELESWKTEREAEEAARAEALERQKNDFAAIEARYKKQLEERDAKLAEATKHITARERADREAALVDAVSAKLPGVPRSVIKGQLRVHEVDPMDDVSATDVAKKIREDIAELLPAKSGGSPGTPGVNLSHKPPSEQPDADPRKAEVLALAKRLSGR